MSATPVWVFGYGSLIWKTDFPYERCVKGFITGYSRKFYQHSIDHRGTVYRPGRVVTLIPDKETMRTFGVAYEISNVDTSQVLDHLDFREKNGYERRNVKFHPLEGDTTPIDLIVYLATATNSSFAGPTTIPEIATQIISATGPSGRNRDYVFNLANSFRELFPGEEDSHLFELEAEVKRLEALEDII